MSKLLIIDKKKQTKIFDTVIIMTSMTMFSPNQNPFNFVVRQNSKPNSA